MLVKAVTEDIAGNHDRLDVMVTLINEAERAKEVLRSKGYGVAGMGILDMARWVP